VKVACLAWRDLANPNAGGSEVLVDRLLRGLGQRDHRAVLVAGGPVGERPYAVIANGGTYSQYVRAPITLARVRDVDVVLDVANGIPFFSPLWRRTPRVLLVTHVQGPMWHTYYFSDRVARLGELLEGRCMPAAYRNDEVIAISESGRDELVALGFDPSRIHVVQCGVDDEYFRGAAIEAAEPTFVALGRLAPHKRIDHLLELWREVQPATGGRLVIVGDGPERARLERAAPPATVFTGFVDEATKRELLGRAWLLVHTAYQEGWGLNVMEAAARGTPTLAYDTVGLRDSVIDGTTGVLAEDADMFAKAWTDLTFDDVRRRRLAEQARARAEDFRWERTIEQVEEVLMLAARERDRRGAKRDAGRKMPTGVRRSIELVQHFRLEQTDPDRFYRHLAHDTVAQLRTFVELRGATVLDVGGGTGFTSEALRQAGATCTVMDFDNAELHLHERCPVQGVLGDAQRMPVRDGSVDVAVASNVLEHVPDPFAALREITRVLKPGSGVAYVSFPNWYSPWGGHETSPWHWFGGERAVERYERTYGHPPKNVVGESLFPIHIGAVLKWFGRSNDLEVLWKGPRYYPSWTRPLVLVPAVREFATWNLLVIARRRPTRVEVES
jgi:glycosyltransferase involved in cell wall biosynthesis/ubiquinone/menaquinone biosynthesis C-methylase UbiE